MDFMFGLWRRVVVLVRRSRFDSDLDEEMRYHLDEEAAEQEAQGLTPSRARQAAERRFGSTLRLREESRAVWGWTAVEMLACDVRRALRATARTPLVAGVVIVSLAVGIGLNTTAFTLADTLLFRPLPVRAPEELVDVFTSTSSGDPFGSSSYPDYLDLRAGNEAFSDMLAFSPMVVAQHLEDRSRVVVGEVVTGNYFQMLGVGAHIGRTLAPSDDRPGADRVVMVSYGFWHRHLGGTPEALGRTLRLHGQTYTLVGIAPPWFGGMTPLVALDIWLPMVHVGEVKPGGIHDTVASPTGTNRLDRRGQRWMFVKGRLKPGVTPDAAAANLQPPMAQLARTFPQTNAGRRASVIRTTEVRLHPAVNQTVAPIAVGFMMVVGLALLVVCANVANVLLAHGLGRSGELAVRQSLGASRWQLVRQGLVEALTLTLLGALGGLALAWGLARMVGALVIPAPFPVGLTLQLDARALWFTLVVTAVAALLGGLAPALRASRADLVGALAAQRMGSVRVARRHLLSLSPFLVAGQIGVSLLLLISAGLLTRSLAAAERADIGFDPAGLIGVAAEPAMAGYDAERTERFWTEAVERARAMPGVERVALATRLPFGLNTFDTWLDIPGHTSPGDGGTTVWSARVSPEYFAVLGVPVLAGRPFAVTDARGTRRVAIVNETMARRFWPGRSAVGQRVTLRDENHTPVEIVGVVRDHRIRTVGEPRQSQIFFALGQGLISYTVLAARTRGDAGRLLADVRRTLLSLESNLVFTEDQTMAAQVAATLLPVRAGAWLVGVVGLVGALLAAIGLYALTARAVARRTREIGIRLALGSTPADVLRLIMRQGLTVAGVGAGFGLLPAAGAAALIAGSVYGVAVADVVAWGGEVVIVLLVSAVANIVPAWRASRLDPVIALRVD